MKSYYYLLVFVLLAISCTDVRFKQPMPVKGEELELIPDDLITFIVSQDSASLKEDLPDLDANIKKRTIPDNMVIKKWKGSYFINSKMDSLWILVVMKPVKGTTDFKTYQLMGNNEETQARLKKITQVREHFNTNGKLEYLELNPTQKEFKAILKADLFEYIELFDK